MFQPPRKTLDVNLYEEPDVVITRKFVVLLVAH